MTGWYLELEDCVIVSVQGEPPHRITAEQLAQNVDQFYIYQPIVVTGIVKEQRKSDYGVTLVLEGHKNVEVHCFFHEHPAWKRILGKSGEHVQVGGYIGIQDQRDVVQINSCIRIDAKHESGKPAGSKPVEEVSYKTKSAQNKPSVKDQ